MGGNVKREPRATPTPKARPKSNGNGVHAEKPKLRPIEELIRKICKDDHTKGIIVR
jgi:hypothetical protein